MAWKFLLVETAERVATVTISRPDALNALNLEVLTELKEAFFALKGDDGVKVVVLTGAGEKAFVAGADVAAMARLSTLEARPFILAGHQAFEVIASFPKPVIAAVNGFALGGGLELALACDYIYASAKAKFGLPEVTLGIIPGWGGTQRLPALVGANRARELIYSGKIIDAAEALGMGLVNQVFPAEGFLDAVRQEALGIAQKSVVALNMAKTAVNAFVNNSSQPGMAVEIQSVSICFASEDQKEGMAAFLAKRKADFKDR